MREAMMPTIEAIAWKVTVNCDRSSVTISAIVRDLFLTNNLSTSRRIPVLSRER